MQLPHVARGVNRASPVSAAANISLAKQRSMLPTHDASGWRLENEPVDNCTPSRRHHHHHHHHHHHYRHYCAIGLTMLFITVNYYCGNECLAYRPMLLLGDWLLNVPYILLYDWSQWRIQRYWLEGANWEDTKGCRAPSQKIFEF